MNQRRRRVVLEEVAQSARDGVRSGESVSSISSPASAADTKTKAYSASAHRRHQKKTTDLFPKRYRALALVVFLLVACVSGLNTLSIYSPQWQDTFTASQMRTFALSGNGSLSSWFSSFLLMLSGLAALQIYALRQHRCDDYRGTYRLWGWFAALLLLASVNCIVDLTGLAHSIAVRLIGSATGAGFVWLVTAKLLLLSVLVLRGLFEVRASVGALAGVIMVWVAYASAVVLEIPAVRETLGQDYALYYGNSLMAGACFTFMSMVQYARFVFLHSNGLLEAGVSASDKKKKVAVPAEPVPKKAKQTLPPVATAPVAAPAPGPVSSPMSKIPVNKYQHKYQQEKSASPLAPKTPTAQSTKKPIKKSNADSPLGSRIKSKPPVSKDFSIELDKDEMEIYTLMEKDHLSKSERRRLRKLQKRQNRAA